MKHSVESTPPILLWLPYLPQSQNRRGDQHWTKRFRLKKKSRSSVGVRSKRPVLRITILACRRPHAGRDSDNWAQTGYKELRDVIARWFGLDDNDHTISWQYRPIDTTGQQGTIVIAEPITP